jgi:hypothetical protein
MSADYVMTKTASIAEKAPESKLPVRSGQTMTEHPLLTFIEIILYIYTPENHSVIKRILPCYYLASI